MAVITPRDVKEWLISRPCADINYISSYSFGLYTWDSHQDTARYEWQFLDFNGWGLNHPIFLVAIAALLMEDSP